MAFRERIDTMDENTIETKGTNRSQDRIKGFFIVILTCLEDKEWVFEEGLYFFNLVRLHLRYWKK
jgi:hypothetical protein